jgi:hypothetical protein
VDLPGDIERFERFSSPAPQASPARPRLTVERIRELLAQRREEFKEIRARAAAMVTYQEVRELLYPVWPPESTGHPDAPDLWRLPVMQERFELAHLWDAGDELPAMLGTPDEWEAVRALQGEIATVVKERDAVLRALERRMRKLQEAEPPLAGADDPHVIRDDDPEAVEWLRGGGMLANNAFGEHEARAFVERLYAAGAERVVIASECIETSEEPPHSDGLRVRLPQDRAARTAVLRVIRKHAPGFSAADDVRRDVAFLWWD